MQKEKKQKKVKMPEKKPAGMCNYKKIFNYLFQCPYICSQYKI